MRLQVRLQGRCGRFKNGIPCTPLCKYFGKNCANPFTDTTRVDDEEEADDALSVSELESHFMHEHFKRNCTLLLYIIETKRIASAFSLWD